MPDRNDFEEFVIARSASLLRTAYLLTGHHPDAEDLLQRTFLKVVPAWPRIQGSPDAYVRTVMVRENVSRWRSRRWREVLITHHTDPPAQAGPAVEDRLALIKALTCLAPRQRAVIVLRYYEDLTEVETARVLGVTVGTIKSQHRDAIARLRLLVPTAIEGIAPSEV